MAIYCGVCAVRIGSAPDNFGGFSVTEDFQGWNPRIHDTCESCHDALAKAVTATANKIAAKNQARVQSLRDERQRLVAQEAKEAQDRADFEREWAARRRSGR